MKIGYLFSTADYADALGVWGDTDTKVARITVNEDGEDCGAEVSPRDLRTLSVALLELADRLDPPEPSLAVQLDETLRYADVRRN